MPDFLDRLGSELRRAAARPPAERDSPPVRGTGARRLRGAGRARPSWLLAAALALLAAACAAAIATRGRPSPGAVPPGEEGLLATTPAAADLRAFAVLRRSRTAGDELPEAMPIALSGASGANLALSRRTSGAGERGTWVIPGRGSLCLLASWPAQHAGGAGCARDEAARAGQLFTAAASVSAPGAEFIAGLVPDGVANVTVRLARGDTLALAVRENVYAAELPAPARSLSYHQSGTTVTLSGVGVSGP